MKVIVKKIKDIEKIIEIKTEYIKLDSFLKLACITNSGGEAKIYILNGKVVVNDSVCTMRGKKLYDGDIVSFNNKKYKVKKLKYAD